MTSQSHVQTAYPVHRILRLPEVMHRTGRSRSGVLRLAATGELTPVKIGIRSVGWVEAEVNDWIAQQIAESRRQEEA